MAGYFHWCKLYYHCFFSKTPSLKNGTKGFGGIPVLFYALYSLNSAFSKGIKKIIHLFLFCVFT